jgi:hypothetical protein
LEGVRTEDRGKLHPPLWTEMFTREEPIGFLEEGYCKFYLHPSYILKSVLKVRNPSGLMRRTKAERATGHS